MTTHSKYPYLGAAPARIVFTFCFFFTYINPVIAGQGPVIDEKCLLEQLKLASAEKTVGEIRVLCTREINTEQASTADEEDDDVVTDKGLVEQRIIADRKAIVSPFSMLSHKPNYFLFGTYNARGWDATAYRAQTKDMNYSNQDVEGQFQISLKVPLALDLFDDRFDIYGAYTNRSFWQMYNRENSEPFRETNHEPEVWLQFENHWQILGFTNVVNTLGLVHQSNGKNGLLSRSWNRMYAQFIFEKENFVFSLKPWIWITKSWSGEDNPDITDYLGHGEFRTAWRRNGHVFSVMLRNQIESRFKKGAVEASWSFPVFDYPYLKGYVQYFYGYGESLIDYNNRVNRIGIGISVTDWLD